MSFRRRAPLSTNGVDILKQPKLRNKTTTELTAELTSAGAQFDAIELKTLPDDDIEEGWAGKPKGLKQILRERGLIDPNNLSQCSKDGKKDASGKVVKNTSYYRIMENCPDFMNELSSLECLCEKLGAKASHSPKFHCEIAGEGIEYDWAMGKGEYRRRPLSAKKGMDNFRGLVRECFGPTVLTAERAKKAAQRARAYICTYFALDGIARDSDSDLEHYQKIPYEKIQQTQKSMRAHRFVLDFDKGHTNAILRQTGQMALEG